MTARAYRVLFLLSLALLATVLALIATASTPPRPACSDAYSPQCATPYQEEP